MELRHKWVFETPNLHVVLFSQVKKIDPACRVSPPSSLIWIHTFTFYRIYEPQTGQFLRAYHEQHSREDLWVPSKNIHTKHVSHSPVAWWAVLDQARSDAAGEHGGQCPLANVLSSRFFFIGSERTQLMTIQEVRAGVSLDQPMGRGSWTNYIRAKNITSIWGSTETPVPKWCGVRTLNP